METSYLASETNDLALVLSGGGALAAYQVGFLRCIAKNFPDLRFNIMTGVSSGAINAAFLANSTANFSETVDELIEIWRNITIDQIFRVDTLNLMGHLMSWGASLASDGIPKTYAKRGLVDTAPLRTFLHKVYQTKDGIRQFAPLSPAVHLCADRILAISTRYQQSMTEADAPAIQGYPPPAQIIGVLMNAVFLDVLQLDASSLYQINHLLDQIPVENRTAEPRRIKLFVLRPSVDLSTLAGKYEPNLPRMFRFFTRGLGTCETESADWLSMVMFEPDYLESLIELGEADAERHSDEITVFLK